VNQENNSRRLAGFLRECLFFERPIQVNGVEGQVCHIEELSRTSRTEIRRLALKVPFNLQDLNGKSALISGRAQGAQFKFEASFDRAEGSYLYFFIPTSYLWREATLKMSFGESVYSLFCQVGAVSSDYLKFLSPGRKQLVACIDAQKINKAMLRCTFETEGRIDFHMSLFRLQKKLWGVGDLASLSGPTKTAERIARSFMAIQTLAQCEDPAPFFWFNFTLGHPIWQKITDFLEQGIGRHHLIDSQIIYYLRTVDLQPSTDSLSLNLTSVKQGAGFKMAPIQAAIFGISNGNYRWESSQELYPSNRRLYQVEHQGSDFLISISQSSPGLCITGLADSAWLVPLSQNSVVSENLVRNALAEVKKLSGVSSIPAVRILPSNQCQLDTSITKTPMKSLLFRTGGLDFFK
jgi:hypothetical protein